MSSRTLNISVSYNQIISLIKQLPAKEKIKLSRELAKEALDEKLTRLLNSFYTQELTEDIITEEVELVRAELYAKKKSK